MKPTRRTTAGASGTLVERGREAFRRHAWAQAYELLSDADGAQPLGIDDLEALATAAYLAGHDAESAACWTRAHNEACHAGEVPRAARHAFWIALDLLNRGERAHANGWIARAQTLLDHGAYDCPERGLLLVLTGRMHIQRGELEAARESAERALALGERFADPDLRALARLIVAQVHARGGEVGVATALFDEVMVAATIGEVSPVAVGILYCAVIDTCQAVFDLGRAREWTLALAQWCRAHPDVVPFRGQCLVHRTEVMRLGGEWTEALAEAEQACAWLSRLAAREYPATPVSRWPAFKYPLGAAYYQLGELHRVRGNDAEAEAAYREASRHGHLPDPGLALLRAAQGQLDVAESAIRRALAQPQRRPVRATLLAAALDILLSVHDHAAARAAADELATMAADDAPALLRALASRAEGAVLLAEGEARDALPPLRQAWAAWQDLECPYEAAQVRVLLARACRAVGDVDAADLELDAARRVFEHLGAAPDVAGVRRLQGSAPAEASAGLTPRELEVIRLVAKGQSNRAIARTLAISERTVDRHVSNILRKLDVPSRSAATAYAFGHGLV